MSRQSLNFDTATSKLFSEEGVTLQDLEAIRLILQGSSVIDWHQLNLTSQEAVDRFLGLLLIDLDDPWDRKRLRFLYSEATNFVEEHLDIRLPADLRAPADIRDVFVEASTIDRRFRRRQVLCCTVLKLLHVINHMEAAELKFQGAVPEAVLLERAGSHITRFGDRMRDEGYPVLAFYGSRKTRNSIITKLLAKRENLAATVFDKLRFRLVVPTQAHILPAMACLSRELFPFNYLIPGESYNNLLNLRRVIRETEHYNQLSDQLQRLRRTASDWIAENNPFSGGSYRMINFIVDFPVRLEDHEMYREPEAWHLLGRVVFVKVEFQILDQKTSEANERGENAHHLYKARQKKTVESRLIRGALSRLRR
jgi:uncharacterized protein (TIGR04552 family)